MDIKEEVKEESSFLNFCSEDERELSIKDLVKMVKIETVPGSSGIKAELEDSATSQNEEHHALRFNETIKEGEIETKIDIKEEEWWLEREDSCSNDDIKDEPHEDFYSTKPPRFSKEGVSSYTSDLLSGEESGNYKIFNMSKDSPECESDIKCHGQDGVGIDISSLETSVSSETSHDWNMVSMPSSSKSMLVQQSNTNKQDVNKEICKAILSHEHRNSNAHDISEKCLKYPPHLEKHQFVLHSKETKRCDVRDKGLNQLCMKTAKLIDDAKQTHTCNMCNKAFTYRSDLRRHKLSHEGVKPHKCYICNKAFTELSKLKSHKLLHDGIKPHRCELCDKAFTVLSHLKRHKLIHEGVKPHKCEICDKAFTELSNLKRHKLIHEGTKPHKCCICNKAFTNLSHLKSHKLIHEGIKPHKCSICNKAFTQSSSLKSHKLIHEGVKPHKCYICNKAFTELSKLKSHKLLHDGIKPHRCELCDKAFTVLSNLKRHKLIHEGVKPHKCDICNKDFTELSVLKRHKVIHEGIKSHKCHICNKPCIDLSALKRHKLIHEEIKPHKCNICNKDFTVFPSLKRHKVIHKDTLI